MSRKIRSAFAATIVALLACLAIGPAPAGAISAHGNKVDLRVVNNSPVDVTANYCPGGHVNTAYNFNLTHDPCNLITFSTHLDPNGGRFQSFKANPLGVIIRRQHYYTQYFFVRNPSIGKPYIVVNGHSYALVQGELKTVPLAGGASVRLHREGDRNGHKIMTIELIKLRHH